VTGSQHPAYSHNSLKSSLINFRFAVEFRAISAVHSPALPTTKCCLASTSGMLRFVLVGGEAGSASSAHSRWLSALLSRDPTPPEFYLMGNFCCSRAHLIAVEMLFY